MVMIQQAKYPKEVTKFLSELIQYGFNIQSVQRQGFVEHYGSAMLPIQNGYHPVAICLQYANPSRIYATLAVDYNRGRGFECVIQANTCSDLAYITDALSKNIIKV